MVDKGRYNLHFYVHTEVILEIVCSLRAWFPLDFIQSTIITWTYTMAYPDDGAIWYSKSRSYFLLEPDYPWKRVWQSHQGLQNESPGLVRSTQMSTGRFLLLSWDSIHGVPPYDVCTVTWWVYLYLVCNDGELGTARHGSSKHLRVLHRNNKALGHMYIRLDCCFPPTSDETTHEAHAIDAYQPLDHARLYMYRHWFHSKLGKAEHSRTRFCIGIEIWRVPNNQR